MMNFLDIVFQEPMSRGTDPETSHEAAAFAKFRSSKHRRMALLSLYKYGSLTDFELADITGLQQNSIGKRRCDCMRAGLVTVLLNGVGKVKRRTPSGASALVWTLTPKGIEYVQETLIKVLN